MDACNFPELLALDLETAESLFASRRMTAGAPRPMDVIFESKSSMQDLYEAGSSVNMDMDLDLAQVNSILSKAAALAYASPRNFSSTTADGDSSSVHSSPSSKPFTDDEFDDDVAAHTTSLRPRTSGRRLQQQQHHHHKHTSSHTKNHTHTHTQSHRDHARSKSTTHAAVSSKDIDRSLFSRHRHQQLPSYSSSSRLYTNDPYEQPRPTTATGINDRPYSPGPIFSISRTKTKPPSQAASAAVPRYSGAETNNAGSGSPGEWDDTDSVDSFELPNISLSRRDERSERETDGGTGRRGGLPLSRSTPSVHRRIQLQEEEHLQQLQQLRQLQQLQKLQQQLQEKQRLQQQLEKQLQLQFQHEQALKEAAIIVPKKKDLFRKEVTKKELVDKELPKLPVSDKEVKDSGKEAPSHLPDNDNADNRRDSHESRQSRQSRQSYGSVCDSYYDYNTDDAASVSSFGFNHPTAHRHSGGGMTISSNAGVRGRQQSVVTMATSITSSGAGCRFSSQSRTLSTMGGPYPNLKSGLRESSHRASLASSMCGAGGCDRHVEFSLDDVELIRDGDDISTKPTTADGSDRDETAADKVNDAASSPQDMKTGNIAQSSWMSFEDDDEEEETYEDFIKDVNGVSNVNNTVPQTQSKAEAAAAIDRPSSSFDIAAISHNNLPPRPKTSAGHSESNVPTDFRAMNDWASKASTRFSRVPAVASSSATLSQQQHHQTIAVPQRRSSLGHQAALESFSQMQQQPKPGYVHRLRHFHSFSDASVYSSDSPRHASNVGGGGGLRSLYDRPKTSSSSHAPFQSFDSPVRTVDEAINANESIDEPLVYLQRTVYRKPVPATQQDSVVEMAVVASTDNNDEEQRQLQQQPARRGREIFSISHNHSDMSRLEGAGEDGDAQEKPFVEPLLVSQFDDDSDDGGQYDNTGNNTRNGNEEHVENDADLFGDFEGAYNYDEGEDKIMMATAMPFSKQPLPPRSLHSVRSQRSQRSLSGYRLHESIPEHPKRFIGGNGAVYDNADETTSNLQSWIEHASRSQQELDYCHQQQQFRQGPMTHIRSAFYDEDEPEVAEVEQEVVNEEADVREQEVVVPALMQNEVVLAPAPAPIAATTATSTTYELQTALQKAQPVPLIFFSQPGIVGIPLPREVVDTLRVSVSCFPETMLSLSSFSIQTIRSYSRKVRRCSQADADDTYRLLMDASPPTLPPSPTNATHHIPQSPASPTAMSFDLGTGVSRSVTAASSTSHSSRRFWKLPKKLAGSSHSGNDNRSAGPALNMFTGFRSSTSSTGSSNHSNGYPLSPTTMGSSAPRMSSVSRRGSARPDNTEDDQSKANGMCFKRIFPTGSDYLCDALYAHILAFNYISLLCPPPPAAGEEVAVPEVVVNTPGATPAADAREPVTAAHTMTTLASSATLFETAQQQQRRQTIRIYVDSDVPLPLAELDDIHTNANANASSRLLSMTSSRPPSRGTLGGSGASGNNDNEDGRMISRKAALLLGITETLEPDSPSQSPKKTALTSSTMDNLPLSSSGFASGRSNSLARRYNSMRRRHHLRMGHSISESTAAASKMIKKALPGTGSNGTNSGSNNKAEISKPIYEDKDVTLIPASGVPATATTTPTPAPAPASVATTAASDASMRDLHAGLHACISQLVATMKLTTGQLGNTLLNAEVARDIDPLFLRTLCELVRSQEEQF
ncbi:hypothetical protein SBRCBS47491_006861 [Sporothrix bragantina]|uniref:Uncharacterized protein n=1 Tax=Sporothrix bragantina TaxID=671064 RepID=A0ABP0C9L1_9PEZI